MSPGFKKKKHYGGTTGAVCVRELEDGKFDIAVKGEEETASP